MNVQCHLHKQSHSNEIIPSVCAKYNPVISSKLQARQDLLPASVSQNEHGVEQTGTPRFHCGIELNPGVTAEIMTTACKPWIIHKALMLDWGTGACGSGKGSVFTRKSGTVKPEDLLSLSHCCTALTEDCELGTKIPSSVIYLGCVFFFLSLLLLLYTYKHVF